MNRQIIRAAMLALILSGTGASGCDDDEADCAPDPSYQPVIDPADFVATVDNPYFPLLPGTKWVYEGGGERIEVTVTDQTRTVMGIPCTVVRDTVTVDGEVAEDTYDWFAQDKDGNVWYMGEDTKEFDGDKVISTEGSWEAGVDVAQPGIVMFGEFPAAGEAYRQEYLVCEAEDMAETSSVGEAVTVPFGSYQDCLKTLEYTPLEPGFQEYKYFCEGIGLVLEEDGAVRVELVEYVAP